MDNCLFCKIIAQDIEANIIYEDDEMLAFNDVNPQAPVHFLLIPKEHIATINDTNNTDIIGKLTIRASKIAKQQGFADAGYRLVMNCNENGGQSVYHIHLHCLADRKLSWPPG